MKNNDRIVESIYESYTNMGLILAEAAFLLPALAKGARLLARGARAVRVKGTRKLTQAAGISRKQFMRGVAQGYENEREAENRGDGVA